MRRIIKEKNRWSYIDGRGVPSTGELQDIVDSGHNDISYFFINDKTGNLDIVSGSRLKQMKKLEKSSDKKNINEDVSNAINYLNQAKSKLSRTGYNNVLVKISEAISMLIRG